MTLSDAKAIVQVDNNKGYINFRAESVVTVSMINGFIEAKRPSKNAKVVRDRIQPIGEFLQMAYKLGVLTNPKGLQALTALVGVSHSGGKTARAAVVRCEPPSGENGPLSAAAIQLIGFNVQPGTSASATQHGLINQLGREEVVEADNEPLRSDVAYQQFRLFEKTIEDLESVPDIQEEDMWQKKAEKATKVTRNLLGRLAGTEDLLTEMTVSRDSLHAQLLNHQVAAASEIARGLQPTLAPVSSLVGKVTGLVDKLSPWGQVDPMDLGAKVSRASA